MKIENHIQDILQLYEFGMNIGRTLDYKKSCDSFLKLLLKRKNLNAAYVLEHNNAFIKSTYSIPLGKDINIPLTAKIKHRLNEIKSSVLLNNTAVFSEIITIPMKKGSVAIFNLQNNSFLVLYTNKNNLSAKDLSKLKPIIDKFSVNLEACRTFEKQEKLLKDLQRQNQELNDYAQLISHDLKSPIQSIEALTTWVLEDHKEVLNTDGKENLKLIKENVEKIDTLVKGILAYSTIDKTEEKNQNVNLNVLIQDIIEKIDTPKKINLSVPKNLPNLRGNQSRLKLLFFHLLQNAIQFNTKETIKIAIGFTENDTFWQFYVKDNGNGIEERFFDKIFVAFQKLEDNYKATGIGLSIVKKIIEIYSGEIWVESIVTKGATFHFKLKK